MVNNSMTPPMEPSSPVEGGIRKRVCKACDRCRLKKSKCDGSSPCSRCRADNAICFFGERKKSHDKVYPKGYVEMLEAQQAQLVVGIQEMYRRLQNGQGWAGSPLSEANNGTPLTHDILERLGALKQEGQTSSDHFEENLEELQKRLLANGAGFMQRETSFDTNSDGDRQSTYDQRKAPPFMNPFPAGPFPPTPPTQSPHPNSARTSSPLKTEFPVNVGQMQPFPTWTSEYDDMDFMASTYEPMPDMSMNAMALQTQLLQAQGSINPCLTMKDWDQQDMRTYFNPNMVS